jgi:hypothetical protein
MAKKGKMTGKVMQVVGIGAGAVASGFVTKFVPLQNEKIKAGIPIALGFFLLGQKGIMSDLGAGMIAGGSLKMAQQFGIGEVGEIVENPVMALDEIDTIEVDGFDDPVSDDTTEEEEM